MQYSRDYPIGSEIIQMRLPWSEQKKPWRHLEQESFEDALVAKVETGAMEILGVGAAFAGTGFSVVCLPVLHLHQEITTQISTRTIQQISK